MGRATSSLSTLAGHWESIKLIDVQVLCKLQRAVSAEGQFLMLSGIHSLGSRGEGDEGVIFFTTDGGPIIESSEILT